MKVEQLLTEKNSGIESWTIHNMSGVPKNFRKIDGFWEKPVEVERWQRSYGDAKKERAVKLTAALQAYAEKNGFRADTDPEMLRQWKRDDADEAREKRAEAAEKKRNRPTLDQLWHHVEEALGNSFPDGDPHDSIAPYLNKHDLDWDDVDKAVAKATRNKHKTLHSYMADMWDSYADDALHDAKHGHHGEDYSHEWFAQANPWR